MPKLRKKTASTTTTLPLTVEMSESLLETVLLKALQPLYGEIAALRQESMKQQQQVNASMTAQAATQDLLISLSKQVLTLLAQQTQLNQTLTKLSEPSDNNEIGDSLAHLQHCLETLGQALTGLNNKLDSNNSYQQELANALASLSQSLGQTSSIENGTTKHYGSTTVKTSKPII